MAKNKTFETTGSVPESLANIQDEKRREDCVAIINLMTKQTGFEPKMWGTAIVGFGSYSYKYDSGHEGTAPLAGLASRSNAITLYLALTAEERDKLLPALGKYKTGKACVYIKKLEDIDTGVLLKMAKCSVKNMREKYPG